MKNNESKSRAGFGLWAMTSLIVFISATSTGYIEEAGQQGGRNSANGMASWEVLAVKITRMPFLERASISMVEAAQTWSKTVLAMHHHWLREEGSGVLKDRRRLIMSIHAFTSFVSG